MAESDATAPQRLAPLLSAPFRPRATIRQLAGSTSAAAIVSLCSLAAAAQVLSVLGEPPIGWQDVQVVLPAVCILAIVQVIFLYLASVMIGTLGRWLGSNADTRSALAWALVPMAWAALAAAILLALRWQTGIVLESAGSILVGVAGIWSLVTAIAMLMEVERFGVIRATITYVIGMFVAVPVVAVFAIFFITLPVRVFLWQPFSIPSGALIPTLVVGDHLFVSKYAYGYSRFSFPFSPPLFSGRILAREPKRGDVVVFRLPRNNQTDYIKRIIGLPGDTIKLRGGVVYINGDAVPRRRIEDCPLPVSGRIVSVPQYVETLPNGVTYRVLDMEPKSPFDNVGPYKVPPGNYFMMGDNRDNSTDSRAKWGVGYVPFENLVGRAEIIFMTVSKDDGSPSFERAFTRLR